MQIDVNCAGCNVGFSTSNKQRFPRVMPCGHSVCTTCLSESLNSWNSYYCRQCSQKINFDHGTTIPVNELFFTLMEKVQAVLRRKEWEHKEENEDLENSRVLNLEDQCAYTFCQRRKFMLNGELEMFCSQQCKKNFEELFAEA